LIIDGIINTTRCQLNQFITDHPPIYIYKRHNTPVDLHIITDTTAVHNVHL